MGLSREFICQRKICSYLISTLFVITHLLIGYSEATHQHDESSNRSELFGGTNSHYLEAAIVSFGLFVTLVIFVMLCSGGCCLNVFGKRRRDETIGRSFNNPIAELGGNSTTSISPIDVRALALDPVIFEPLPSVNELAPSPSNYYSRLDPHPNWQHFHHHPNVGLPSNHYAGITTGIIPTDETNVYAHDWFDEPYRNFPRGNIIFEKEVGKGWFGKVIEATAEDIVPYTKKLSVIVKVLREDATGMEQMRFLDESRLYRDVNHGNVLKLLGHSIETLPFLLMMEHCPQGDLKSFLIANVGRAEILNAQGALVRMALDIAKGLQGMASANFIHKDLACRNCQVGSEGRIIIGDYGTQAQMFCDDYYWGSNVAIPLRWSAPETIYCTINTIQTLKVLKSSNIWTFGVVLWEICEFGKLPYFELNDDDVLSRVITDKNYTLGLPSRAGLAMKDELFKLMLSCWNHEPEQRPTINTVVDQLEIIYTNLKATVVASPTVSPTMSPRNVSSGLKSTNEDFDKKWEEFGNKENAPSMTPNEEDSAALSWKHDQRTTSGNSMSVAKKKSVSFVGMDDSGGDDDIPLVQIKSSTSIREDNLHNQEKAIDVQLDGPLLKGHNISLVPSSSSNSNYQSESLNQVLPLFVTKNTSPVDEPELKLRNENLYSNSVSSEALLLGSMGDGGESIDQMDSWKEDSPDLEDEKWRQRIEQGEISKKVLEKTQIQDLMVLTHVEPSDLSDPDSLLVVTDSLLKKYGSGSALDFSPLNFNLSSEMNGGESNLRKSNSETALNSFSLISSSTPDSTIVKSNGVCNNTLLLNSDLYSGEESDTVVHNNVTTSDFHTKNDVLTSNNNNNSIDISVGSNGGGSSRPVIDSMEGVV